MKNLILMTTTGLLMAALLMGATPAPAGQTAAVNIEKQDPCKDPPGIDTTRRDIHHEFGHIKYARLTKQEKAVWKSIWTAVIATDRQPCQQTADGTNYFEANDMEGFCVAYSYIKLGVDVDPTITNFFNNL